MCDGRFVRLFIFGSRTASYLILYISTVQYTVLYVVNCAVFITYFPNVTYITQ